MKQRENSSDTAIQADEMGHLVFALIHAGKAIEDRLEGALARADLSLAKFGVLSELARAAEPLTLGELATRLSCVRSNMTQLIDRLESDGLVRRVDDPSDRRTVRAALTSQGRTQQAAGDREMRAMHAELTGLFSGSDRAMLDRIVGSL